jgi:putative component of membrane protein insertase Oxa1/YidC/SpoIIIJ protein YidD
MKEPSKPHSREHWEAYGTGKNYFLDIYQKWISPVKGGNTCPMYPSCSQYAKISFQVLPWYKAYTSSLERLLRCGNELQMYPRVRVNGQIRWYDPVITEDSNKDVKIDPDDR